MSESESSSDDEAGGGQEPGEYHYTAEYFLKKKLVFCNLGHDDILYLVGQIRSKRTSRRRRSSKSKRKRR